jgi:hypothetical protein
VSGDRENEPLRVTRRQVDRPRRLVLSWADPAVRLTVTHDDLEPGSGMAQGVSKGWPMVVASLKTLLETGEPMPPTWVREGKGWKPIRFANP